MRFKTFKEWTKDEASRLRRVVIFAEVRQCSSRKSKRASLTVNVLIAQRKQDLRQVSFWTFRFGSDHFIDTVEIGWDFLRDYLLHRWQSVIQACIDVIFEWICDSFTPLMEILIFDRFLISIFVQNAIVQFIDFSGLFFDIVLDLSPRNAVRSSHRERVRD